MDSFKNYLSEGKGPEQDKYHAGVPDKKKERVRHFKRGTFKDAPGDKEARKKGMRQSKHTEKYQDLYGGDLKESEMHKNTLGKWVHKGPAEYSEKLLNILGDPDVVEKQDYGRVRSATWYHVDGFDSLMVEDENTTKYHPIPGVQVYVYGMKKLIVPKEMVEPLHKSSETIKIDQLKNQVTASCASTTICAVTLNYVMDCIAGRVSPSVEEYDKRVLSVVEDNKLDPDFDWWPDETRDIRSEPLKESNSFGSFTGYLVENKGLRKKAKETGISYGILKQVYKRGVAAWKTGHRPGTTPQQWGMARVNSFATGGKTRTTADKDLWAKHIANKKKKKKKKNVKEEKTPKLNMNEDLIVEAEYQGKNVKLNDPIRNASGKKKFRVYTTHPKTGNVIKVQFGDPGLSIKRDSDKRREAFRARHGCDAVTFESDRHTPKYWSCKMWTKSKKVSELD